MNMQQQQQQQQQSALGQQFMTQPPDVLSTKDLAYLHDMLAWNLLGAKRAHFIAQQCQDPEIKGILEQAGQMHERHYQTLLNHLTSHQNQQPPMMQ